MAGDGPSAEPMKAWVRGFVTASIAKRDVDTNDLTTWFDKTCKANPAMTLYTAAGIYVTLRVPDPGHPVLP